MKVKLNISLLAPAVMLFLLSGTVYAMPSHSDPDATGGILLENPDRVTIGDKAELRPEVTGNIPPETPDGFTVRDKARLGPETRENIALEDPDVVTLENQAQRDPEVTTNIAVENPLPPSETTPIQDSLVSKWLEARASEEAVVREVGRQIFLKACPVTHGNG